MKTASRKGRAWALLSPKVLRKAREREGLSRKALADKLGVSSGAVQNWEADASTPSQEMQQKILDTLKIGAEPTEGAATVEAAPKAPKLVRRVTVEAPKDVSSAAAAVVSAMIHKGTVTTLDEIKATLSAVTAMLRS